MVDSTKEVINVKGSMHLSCSVTATYFSIQCVHKFIIFGTAAQISAFYYYYYLCFSFRSDSHILSKMYAYIWSYSFCSAFLVHRPNLN